MCQGLARFALERRGQSFLAKLKATELRFEVGDTVECNMGTNADGSVKWEPGVITKCLPYATIGQPHYHIDLNNGGCSVPRSPVPYLRGAKTQVELDKAVATLYNEGGEPTPAQTPLPLSCSPSTLPLSCSVRLQPALVSSILMKRASERAHADSMLAVCLAG